jgi:hypothetical protein
MKQTRRERERAKNVVLLCFDRQQFGRTPLVQWFLLVNFSKFKMMYQYIACITNNTRKRGGGEISKDIFISCII